MLRLLFPQEVFTLQGVVMMELNSVLANPIDIKTSLFFENGTYSWAQTSESPQFNVSIDGSQSMPVLV